MNNKTILLVGIMIIISNLVACGTVSHPLINAPAQSQSPRAPSAAQAPADQNTAAKAPASETSVEIKNFAFNPAEVSIVTGSTIIWTNNDPYKHTVTFDDGSADLSVAAGATVTKTFENNGEFTYYCAIHPSMKGKVIVN